MLCILFNVAVSLCLLIYLRKPFLNTKIKKGFLTRFDKMRQVGVVGNLQTCFNHCFNVFLQEVFLEDL